MDFKYLAPVQLTRMSSGENQLPVVTNPSVEFLLKQVYAAYSQQITSLTEQLDEANAKLAKKSVCSFCTTLTKEVQDLRNQLEQLLKEQSLYNNKVDISVQASLPEILVPLPLDYASQVVAVSPARKRPRSCQVASPARSDVSDSSKLEDVLVPNTPEHNPQRESRVKRWFQTMEVLETVEPNVIEVLLKRADMTHVREHGHLKNVVETRNETTLDPAAKTPDLDETMLPDSFVRTKLRIPVNPSSPEQMGEYSDASSEDLLDGAVQDLSKENRRAERSALRTSLKSNNNNPGQPRAFKYKDEPVRKRGDRMKLPAQQCADCAKYFADEEGAKRKDICSRHRATYAAPPTPEHFWELDFPDTEQCKERGYHNITQKVQLRSRRARPFKSLEEAKV